MMSSHKMNQVAKHGPWEGMFKKVRCDMIMRDCLASLTLANECHLHYAYVLIDPV